MITLAHISDIHLSPMPPIALRDLVGKRLTGYLNWKLRRNEELNSETLASLVAHLQGQNADFTAVTGDLVNLALDFEMDRAAKWLQALGGAVGGKSARPAQQGALMPLPLGRQEKPLRGRGLGAI